MAGESSVSKFEDLNVAAVNSDDKELHLALESGESSREWSAVPVQSHIDQGLAYYKKGKLHEAFMEFLQVLAIDPLDPIGHYLCGLTLQAFKLEDMAVAEWAAASSLYIRDGGKWDSDWDWMKGKCYEFVENHRQSSSHIT